MEKGIALAYYAATSYVQGRARSYGEAEILFYRDFMKSILDPSDTGADYKVSEIAEWTGASNGYGLLFVVEERDGVGVPTGQQYVFAFPLSTTDNTGPWGSYVFGANNSTTFYNYIGTMGGNGNSYSLRGSLIFGYLPYAGTRRSRITVSATGTHNVGDVIRNSGSTKFGIIRDISGSEWIVEHTKGPKWAAADSLVNVDTADTATVSSEDWRSFLDMGWDDFDEMTFSSGGSFGDTDFSAPATSPYTSIADFMPLTSASSPFINYKWRTFDGHAGGVDNLLNIVFNNTLDICTLYCYRGRAYTWVNDIGIFGTVFKNENGNTEYVEGAIGIRLGLDDNGYYQNTEFIEGRASGAGTSTAGAYATYSTRQHTNFVVTNSPHASDPDKYPESPIYISNATDPKGWVRRDVARIQGPGRRFTGLRLKRNGHTSILIHPYIMTPYAENIAMGLIDMDIANGKFQAPGSRV